MLKDWVKAERPGDEEITERLQKARAELTGMQLSIKEKKLPVLVIFDGWGGAGKGSVLGKVIKNLDPRFYKTETLSKPSEDELRGHSFTGILRVSLKQESFHSLMEAGWMRSRKQSSLIIPMKTDITDN